MRTINSLIIGVQSIIMCVRMVIAERKFAKAVHRLDMITYHR